MTEPVSQHTIAGTVLTMPVKIRKATQHTAMFSVDADAAQAMIDYSGLHVSRYLPGRAVVALILAHFIDGDLGEYHELSTGVMIDQPGAKASRVRALQSVFIHHMLVDQAFTLEAGRTIWGFPKVMADFTIRDVRQFGFDASVDGQLVAGMEFASRPCCSVGGVSRESRCCAHTRIATVRRWRLPSRCRWWVLDPGREVCGSGWVITRTRKNLRRWACRSAR